MVKHHRAQPRSERDCGRDNDRTAKLWVANSASELVVDRPSTFRPTAVPGVSLAPSCVRRAPRSHSKCCETLATSILVAARQPSASARSATWRSSRNCRTSNEIQPNRAEAPLASSIERSGKIRLGNREARAAAHLEEPLDDRRVRAREIFQSLHRAPSFDPSTRHRLGGLNILPQIVADGVATVACRANQVRRWSASWEFGNLMW